MDVWGFFYGGLINQKVMDRVGFQPTERLRASLPGFDLTISPLVNVIAAPGSTVFGLLLKTSHRNLAHVYGQLQAIYLPFPVLAFDDLQRAIPALCYIAPDMSPGQADREHVLNLLEPAEALQFPEWYLRKIRGFLPPPA